MLQAIILVSVAALVGLDQWTKWLAVVNLKDHVPQTVIPQVVSFSYVENRGAAWGILEGQSIILIGLTAVVTLAILVVLCTGRFKRHKMANVAAVLIAAGGIGNLIDRIFRGYVVDFIKLDFINFPVFNVADMCVTCGAILLLVYCIFFYTTNDNKKKTQEGGRHGTEDMDTVTDSKGNQN